MRDYIWSESEDINTLAVDVKEGYFSNSRGGDIFGTTRATTDP
jgi:hypothetical protein